MDTDIFGDIGSIPETRHLADGRLPNFVRNRAARWLIPVLLLGGCSYGSVGGQKYADVDVASWIADRGNLPVEVQTDGIGQDRLVARMLNEKLATENGEEADPSQGRYIALFVGNLTTTPAQLCGSHRWAGNPELPASGIQISAALCDSTTTIARAGEILDPKDLSRDDVTFADNKVQDGLFYHLSDFITNETPNWN